MPDVAATTARRKKMTKSNENQRCEICQAPISSIELECSHGLSEKYIGIHSEIPFHPNPNVIILTKNTYGNINIDCFKYRQKHFEKWNGNNGG